MWLGLALHLGVALGTAGLAALAWAPHDPGPMAAAGLAGLAVGAALWPALRRIGPRNVARPVLLLLALVALVTGLRAALRLPPEVGYVALGLAGAGLATSAGTWAAKPPGWMAVVAAVPVAASLALLDGPIAGILAVTAAVAGVVVLGRAPDPVRPDDPVQRLLPWTDGTGRPWTWGRLPRRAPFILLYLVAAWTLFLALAESTPTGLRVPPERVDAYVYHIADLSQDPLRAFASLATAPWIQAYDVQMVYVTVLLLFGLAFEVREGTPGTLLVFWGTSALGAIVGGILLHVVPPDEYTDRAWRTLWSGASVGAFGLMGAFAARARVPWPLLGFFLFWELNVGLFHLRSWTPAFHATALLAGFAATRWWLRPIARQAPASG